MSKVRAVVYTRVSTNKEEQKTSLVNQKEFYTNYCNQKGYELVGIYADEGTGTNVRQRYEFIRMMESAGLSYRRNNRGTDLFNQSNREPNFDLIIVKDAPRFSRNTQIGLNTVEQLKAKGVFVLFENAGVHSGDENADFIIPLLFTIAQNESANMSKRIKFAKNLNANKGIYNPSQVAYGYERIDGEYFPHPQESEIIKWMYDTIRNKKDGTFLIAQMLNQQGITTKRGKEWTQATVSRTLRRKIYTGTAEVRKKTKLSVTDTKDIKRPKDEWIEIPNAVPPIVSLEEWEEVQSILNSRINNKSGKGRKVAKSHPYTDKIFCNCGALMYLHYSDKGNTFMCSARRKKGTCKVRGIRHTALNKLFDLVGVSASENDMGNYVYHNRLLQAINEQQQTLEQQRNALTSQIDELEQDNKQTVKALKQALKDSAEAVRKALEKDIEENTEQINLLNEQLEKLKMSNILKLREQIERKAEIIDAVKSQKQISDDEKIKLLKRIEVDDFQVAVEFSLPSYQEEVEAFNQLFPNATIETDYPFDSMKTTIKRQHKESILFWETVEQNIIDAHEAMNEVD